MKKLELLLGEQVHRNHDEIRSNQKCDLLTEYARPVASRGLALANFG
jgi:hypothetical protein